MQSNSVYLIVLAAVAVANAQQSSAPQPAIKVVVNQTANNSTSATRPQIQSRIIFTNTIDDAADAVADHDNKPTIVDGLPLYGSRSAYIRPQARQREAELIRQLAYQDQAAAAGGGPFGVRNSPANNQSFLITILPRPPQQQQQQQTYTPSAARQQKDVFVLPENAVGYGEVHAVQPASRPSSFARINSDNLLALQRQRIREEQDAALNITQPPTTLVPTPLPPAEVDYTTAIPPQQPTIILFSNSTTLSNAGDNNDTLSHIIIPPQRFNDDVSTTAMPSSSTTPQRNDAASAEVAAVLQRQYANQALDRRKSTFAPPFTTTTTMKSSPSADETTATVFTEGTSTTTTTPIPTTSVGGAGAYSQRQGRIILDPSATGYETADQAAQRIRAQSDQAVYQRHKAVRRPTPTTTTTASSTTTTTAESYRDAVPQSTK